MVEASHPLQTPSYFGPLGLWSSEKTDTSLIGRKDPGSQSVRPGTPFHFLHCHRHPQNTPGLLMVLLLRNLNIFHYVLICTELNTHPHPKHCHACLTLSYYQGGA